MGQNITYKNILTKHKIYKKSNTAHQLANQESRASLHLQILKHLMELGVSKTVTFKISALKIPNLLHKIVELLLGYPVPPVNHQI